MKTFDGSPLNRFTFESRRDLTQFERKVEEVQSNKRERLQSARN